MLHYIGILPLRPMFLSSWVLQWQVDTWGISLPTLSQLGTFVTYILAGSYKSFCLPTFLFSIQEICRCLFSKHPLVQTRIAFHYNGFMIASLFHASIGVYYFSSWTRVPSIDFDIWCVPLSHRLIWNIWLKSCSGLEC